MTHWQEYKRPESISEAVHALSTSSGTTCLIAGGTDLMVDLLQGRQASINTLVDITSIPELNLLEIRGKDLYIGAALPLNRIAFSPLVIEHAQALSEACSLIGGPQVRNVATLGGNVAHALPAADGTIAMMSLDAEVLVASRTGIRKVPLQEMFLGPGKTAINTKEEIITGFRIPLRRKNQASAFKRIMRAQGIALPIINTSAWLERRDNKIIELRIAIGPSGLTPSRMTLVENLLKGCNITVDFDTQALEALFDQVQFRTSPQRASAQYRHHLVKDLFVDTLMKAWKRAE